MLAVLRGLAMANLLRNQSLYGNVRMKSQVPCEKRLLAMPAASNRSDSRHRDGVLCTARLAGTGISQNCWLFARTRAPHQRLTGCPALARGLISGGDDDQRFQMLDISNRPQQ